MNAQGQDSVVYFTILIVMQVLVLILSFIFEGSLTMFNIIRLLSLIGAKCMDVVTWVILYIIYALISALYSFDPVGLWITGHGQARTGAQNGFCFVIFLLLCAATYVGFLYFKAFGKQIAQDFVGQGYSNPNQGGNAGGNGGAFGNFGGFGGFGGGNGGNDPNAGGYGGNSGNQRQGFQQFSGQGYSLN